MADLKSLMPHIRRAAVANGIMILFFLSPSFLSFLAILVAISVVFLDNPSESLKCLLNCSEECSLTKCINESFDKFRNVTILESNCLHYSELMFLVLFKLAIDFSWLIPTCVLIVLGTELFSAWELLKELGLIELAKKYIDLAHKSLDKVMGMIPKYKAIWLWISLSIINFYFPNLSLTSPKLWGQRVGCVGETITIIDNSINVINYFLNSCPGLKAAKTSSSGSWSKVKWKYA